MVRPLDLKEMVQNTRTTLYLTYPPYIYCTVLTVSTRRSTAFPANMFKLDDYNGKITQVELMQLLNKSSIEYYS